MRAHNGEGMTNGFRALALLLLLGVAGLVVTIALTDAVNPRASINVETGRTEILERGTAFLTGLGHRVDTLHLDAWSSFNAEVHIYLQHTVGMERANAILRTDSLPGHHWFLWWFDRSVPKSQNKDQFYAWLSMSGKVLGFQHLVLDSVPLPSLDGATAEKLARAFLDRQGISVADYQIRDASDIRRAHRTDHNFVWVKGEGGAETTVWVLVMGEEVGGFRVQYTPTGDFPARFTQETTSGTMLAMVSFAVIFFLLLFMVVLFLKKYHEGEVGTRTGMMVFIGIFAVSAVALLNQFPAIGSTWGIGDLNPFNTRIVVTVLNVCILQVFLAAMVFAGWSVGESSSRSLWPWKLKAADSVLMRRFFTHDLGVSILRGYAWGGILSGVVTLTAWGMIRFGHSSVFVGDNGGVPDSFVKGLQPIMVAFGQAVFAEIVFRLFFLSFLRERMGRSLPGVLFSTALWTFAALSIWQLPFGTFEPWRTIPVLFVFGLVMSMLFLRYDLVTTIGANFIVGVLGFGIPIFSSAGDAMLPARILFVLLFAAPLCIGIVGAVRRERFEFTAETMPAHIRRITERERMAKELEIARSVQMSLLPKTDPILDGYDLAGICLPAQEVGGDYYDFVNLAGRKLGIAVGDVSGKGVPAAIYMTLTKGILQSHAEDSVSPRSVLTKVNNLMYRTIDRNSFVSMFYAILDLRERTIRFARAGQCPLILTQMAGEKGAFLTPRGMALGLEMGKVFESVLEEQDIALHPGEVLAFYTDGFTEAMNDREEEFGEARLAESIARHRQKTAKEIIEHVCRDVREFAGDRPQHDDMTMVVLKVT